MRFIFDCEDEICLPRAYKLIDAVKPFLDKVKNIDVEEGEDKKAALKKVFENIMVKYPKDTSELLSKMWILEEVDVPKYDKNGNYIKNDKGEIETEKKTENAPNAFKTISTIFTNEVAVDFFTSVMPSMLSLSRSISPLLKSEK